MRSREEGRCPKIRMSTQKPFYQRRRLALLGVALLCVALLLILLRETSSRGENPPTDHASELTEAGKKTLAPELAADPGRAALLKSKREAGSAPSLDDWAAILDGKYSAEGLMDRVEATGRDYTIAQLIDLERVMRGRAGSEWDPEALLYMIGMAVAERYPEAFMQDGIEALLGDRESTAFVDDLIRQSIAREIGRGQERGWQAIERIAKRSAAEPARNELRYLILHRTLVEVGGLDPARNLERALELWTPDSEYTRDSLRSRILKEAERIAAAKQNGPQPEEAHGR